MQSHGARKLPSTHIYIYKDHIVYISLYACIYIYTRFVFAYAYQEVVCINYFAHVSTYQHTSDSMARWPTSSG